MYMGLAMSGYRINFSFKCYYNYSVNTTVCNTTGSLANILKIHVSWHEWCTVEYCQKDVSSYIQCRRQHIFLSCHHGMAIVMVVLSCVARYFLVQGVIAWSISTCTDWYDSCKLFLMPRVSKDFLSLNQRHKPWENCITSKQTINGYLQLPAVVKNKLTKWTIPWCRHYSVLLLFYYTVQLLEEDYAQGGGGEFTKEGT